MNLYKKIDVIEWFIAHRDTTKACSGNGEELRVLRDLNKTIDLYWTGDDVNAPITQETVNFVQEKTNHKPVYWLNYSVNEHSKSGIYLGDISYYARDNVSGMAGFVSNPSRFAESNKVALLYILGSKVIISDDNKTYVGTISYSVNSNDYIPKELQEENLYGGYVEVLDEFMLSLQISKVGDFSDENDMNDVSGNTVICV